MKVPKRSRIPICLGKRVETTDGYDFECGYGVGWACENCKVNGGDNDPRDGDPDMDIDPWTDDDVADYLKTS